MAFRGVSRWDTCGPQAVLEAFGGQLIKLRPFEKDLSIKSYDYSPDMAANSCWEPGLAKLTPFNRASSDAVDTKSALSFKKYANLQGFIAVRRDFEEKDSADLYAAIQRAKARHPVEYS